MTLDRPPGQPTVALGVAIDPQTWTLAGLGLPSGEPVTDEVARRKLGYWDGKALSPTPVLPSRSEVVISPFRPNPTRLIEVARLAPRDPIAIDAAAEIARRQPATPELREALGLLASYHPDARGMGEIGLRSMEAEPEAAEILFRAILERHQVREELGLACFGLAEVLKRRSETIGRAESGEAARLFERVIASHGEVRHRGLEHPTIGESATLSLADLRTTGIGKPAPPLAGTDLDDKPLALGDDRGKVIVVQFWSTSCGACLKMVPRERELVARLSGKPFAFVGVNGDDDRSVARATRDRSAVTWPSLWLRDGLDSVAGRWGIHTMPTTYLIDSRGIIRFKNLSGDALDKAVASLVDEAGR